MARIVDHTDDVFDESDRLVEQKLTDTGRIIEGAAALLAPVLSGDLKGSITKEVDPSGKKVRVGTTVDYGPPVEMGTDRMAAQPHLVPAVLENKALINKVWNG